MLVVVGDERRRQELPATPSTRVRTRRPTGATPGEFETADDAMSVVGSDRRGRPPALGVCSVRRSCCR